MRQQIIMIMILLLLVGCTPQADPVETGEITLTASDGTQLAATFSTTEETYRAVVLLHQVGGEQSDWQAMHDFLYVNGFAIITLDFRGHGANEGDYETFGEEDWQSLQLDVKAAIDYLELAGHSDITVMGAGTGANVALQEAVTDERVDRLVLLSPGENYYSITTLDIAGLWSKPAFIIASYQDVDGAVAATRIFNEMSTVDKRIEAVSTGHGVEMLNEELAKELATWIVETQS